MHLNRYQRLHIRPLSFIQILPISNCQQLGFHLLILPFRIVQLLLIGPFRRFKRLLAPQRPYYLNAQQSHLSRIGLVILPYQIDPIRPVQITRRLSNNVLHRLLHPVDQSVQPLLDRVLNQNLLCHLHHLVGPIPHLHY